jgi:iron complex outermembrane receptor protein
MTLRPQAPVAGLLILLASVAGAEPLRMPEITVEASPIDPYLPARTAADRSEIVDAHKSELSDVLELTPGLNVRQGGQGEQRVDMRGFDQRATLLTLNGVPVYEPYNGIINIDIFPLEMLDSVQITRGASSSLYGPNGMGGQIKLNTFAPRAPLTAGLSTTWRDSDLWDVRASGGAAHEGWSGFAAGRYLTTPNFSLADGFQDRPDTQRRFQTGSKRLNSDVEQRSGFATLGYEYGEGGRVHVAVLASDATFGIPPSTLTPAEQPVLTLTERHIATVTKQWNTGNREPGMENGPMGVPQRRTLILARP